MATVAANKAHEAGNRRAPKRGVQTESAAGRFSSHVREKSELAGRSLSNEDASSSGGGASVDRQHQTAREKPDEPDRCVSERDV